MLSGLKMVKMDVISENLNETDVSAGVLRVGNGLGTAVTDVSDDVARGLVSETLSVAPVGVIDTDAQLSENIAKYVARADAGASGTAVGCDEDGEETLDELTKDVAFAIIGKLSKLMGDGDADSQMSIVDMKDAVSMFKQVGDYVQKSGGNKSTDKGLASFVARLKA